jgi:hypothetical protein
MLHAVIKSNAGGLLGNSHCGLNGLDACVMDFDNAQKESEIEAESKGKQEVFLNLSQIIHPFPPKSLLPLSLPGESVASSLSMTEIASTLSPVTNIKPPPTLFADLWGDSDSPSTQDDETLSASIFKPNRITEENQDVFVSENVFPMKDPYGIIKRG